jgi:GT2 family glycosyltransferase
MTDISVIVTCHNYGSYLAQCLASITGQHYKAARIILIDDASDDDTPEIALSFPDIEYVRVEYKDVCQARDDGLKMCATPWILYVDADNWLQFRYLEFLHKHALSCDRHVGAIYPSKKIFGRYDDVAIADPYEEDRLDTQAFMDMCALIRVSALRDVGGWHGPMRDERGPNHDDWALWLRMRSNGWVFEPCPNALLMYRAHNSNYSALGGLQSPNTILRHARFTLLTVMSGRNWALGPYMEWLARMDCVPEQVDLMIVDNSGSLAFGRTLRLQLALQERFPNYRYLKMDRVCDPESAMTNAQFAEGDIPIRVVRDPAIHRHVAGLYATAFSHVTDDFIWTVEDDVIPQDDALIQLIKGIAWDRKAGAIGAVVMSRLHEGKPIAGPDDIVLNDSLQRVGFVSAGCTLYRTRALKTVRPRYEETDKGILFWDVSVGEDMADAGWHTMLNTAVRTKHYEPDGSYV